MLDSLSKKQKIFFFIILAIMVIVIIYYIYSNLYKNKFNFSYNNNIWVEDDLIENSNNTINTNFDTLNTNDTNEISNSIIVYVCGAVKENKVITIKENSRVCDAIDAVGGLTKDADLTNINLAYMLEDGEKIYIPKKGEEILNNSSTSSQTSSYSTYSSSSTKNNKININKATQTELETIPGIGPSTALKILDYREKNGNFSKIEDIKNVSGIGNTKYEKIKDYIIAK